MPLADLSIDDAIALACREVPECCHALEWHWEDGDSFQTARWVHTEGGPLVDGPMLRAIWFSTAWEWLEKVRERTLGLQGGVVWSTEYNEPGWYVWKEQIPGEWDEVDDFGPYPTKFHALAAAVLLAAGKVVP